jgi:SNF2 family DNA or RNA helicase
MIFNPHPYQQHALAQVLEHTEVGLFLDMGLGKTAVTLTAIAELLDRFEVRRVLVVAPLRVAQTVWSDEIAKWDHLRGLRLVKVLGTPEQRRQALRINRENICWLELEYTKKPWPFDMVVLDEISSFKCPTGQRFKALRRLRPGFKRVVGLTGTPTPKGLLDLWAQVYLLDQGQRLGKRYTGYRDNYFEPDKRNRTQIWSWRPQDGAEAKIQARIRDLCISMSADDWLQMPDRIDNVVYTQLPNEARNSYDRLEAEMTTWIKDRRLTVGTAAVGMGKLLQMCNGAVYAEDGSVLQVHDRKIDALQELVEASDGHPVLIFYSYRHDIPRIQKATGATLLEHPEQVAEWNAGKIPVLLSHPASAGHGLNLQAGGHTIIWYGLPWALELYQQANARLYRQGQEHSVIIHHLIAKDTVEETVLQALQDKRATQDRLLEAVKARLVGPCV